MSFTFTWDDGETEDRAKVSTSPLFEGSSINNTELWDILMRTKMHANTDITKIRCVCPGIISKLSPLPKVKFKVTPIERQSL